MASQGEMTRGWKGLKKKKKKGGPTQIKCRARGAECCVFKRNVPLVSHANHPVGPDIAINKFPTDTVAGQSFTSIDRSKHLSLELRGISSRCGRARSCMTAVYCLSVFHYSQSNVDDGEGKDYTSGWVIGFEQSCCIHFVSTQGSNYT